MSLPVSLKQVAEEIDALPEDWTAYVNRRTGELYSISNEQAMEVDSPDEENEEDRPDWEKETLAQADEIMNSEDWIALPGRYEINEWAIMRDFAQSQTEQSIAEDLLRAIQGRGAFRYFKDRITQYGIREQWFAFKDTVLQEIAREALEEAGIPFTDCAD